jgi:hypothetical protein
MDEFSDYTDHALEAELKTLRIKEHALYGTAEDVIRACGQFVPLESLSAVTALERLATLAGLPPAILNRALGR